MTWEFIEGQKRYLVGLSLSIASSTPAAALSIAKSAASAIAGMGELTNGTPNQAQTYESSVVPSRPGFHSADLDFYLWAVGDAAAAAAANSVAQAVSEKFGPCALAGIEEKDFGQLIGRTVYGGGKFH